MTQSVVRGDEDVGLEKVWLYNTVNTLNPTKL